MTSVKLYMAYPERLMVDDATLQRALEASLETGVRVCVHAEDGAAKVLAGETTLEEVLRVTQEDLL